jgi:transcriptional regulator with XRE-family HTH domain
MESNDKFKSEYDKKAIGLRLHLARVSCRLTQEYVAEQCGIKAKQISMIERGESGPKISTLMQLCKVLKTSCDYILYGTEIEPKNPMDKLTQQLTLEQQNYAVEMIRLFVEALNQQGSNQ